MRKYLSLFTLAFIMFFLATSCEEHIHNYVATPIDELYHSSKCECGDAVENEHAFELQEVLKEPTMDSDGEYKVKCKICAFETVIKRKPVHIHAFSTQYLSDESGHWVECACGQKNNVDKHVYGDWETKETPTEETNGISERKCLVCNYTQTNSISKLEHTHEFGEWWISANPDSNFEGVVLRKCKKNCTYMDRELLPKLSQENLNVYEYIVKQQPTCTTIGKATYSIVLDTQTFSFDVDVPMTSHGEAKFEQNNSTYHYSVCECGHKYTSKHEFTEWFIENKPTCVSEGTKSRKCQQCNYEEKSAIEKTDHNFGPWQVDIAATCTNIGESSRHCLDCDFTEKKQVEKLSHNITEVSYDKPTCHMEGKLVTKCLDCEEINEKLLPKLEHKLSDWINIVEVSCHNDGVKIKKCLLCEDEVEREIVIQLEHEPDEVKILKDSTCTEEGLQEVRCILCGDLLKETIIEKKPHIPSDWEIAIEATCSIVGKKECYCTVCDEIIKTEDIEKLDHDLDNWEIVTEATCLIVGKKAKICKVCKEEVETEDIEKLEHKEIELKAKDPTCEEKGNKLGTICSECDTVLSGGEILDIVDHAFEKGVCKWCEEKQIITVSYYSKLELVETKTFNYGDKFFVVELPDVGLDYVEGWYSLDEETKYDENFTLVEDIKVYAKWNEWIGISTADELIAIKEQPDKQYYLKNRINLKGISWEPIKDFNGILDGKGYSIENFTLITTTAAESAFIITNNGTIKNLVVHNVICTISTQNIRSSYYSILVSKNNGEIDNVTIRDSQYRVSHFEHDTGNDEIRISCIAAYNKGTIKNSTNNVDISIDLYSAIRTITLSIGGVCGRNTGNITNCINDSSISALYRGYGHRPYSTSYYANFVVYSGGVCGNNSGEISESISTLDYSNTSETNNYVNYYGHSGAFVGLNSGYINKSIGYGNINVNYKYQRCSVGGFVGYNEVNGKIEDCYANAELYTNTDASVGGFVGTNKYIILTSYSKSNITNIASSYAAGFVGNNTSSGNIGKCYSTGNITTKSGSTGYFVGTNAGSVYKIYHFIGSIVTVNGVVSSNTYDKDLSVAKKLEVISSKEFLSDEIYWDTDIWAIYNDKTDPELIWNFINGHFENETITVVEPTCTTFGYKIHVCECGCGRYYSNEYVEPLGHEYGEEEVTAPSCTDKGFTTKHCITENCDHYMVYDYVDALGHTEVVDDAVSATCTTAGLTEGKHCSVCDEVLVAQQIVDALGHSYQTTVTAPTCTKDGYTTHTCSGCDDSYVDGYVDALGHTEVVLDAVEANCTQTGLTEGKYCLVCSDVLVEQQIIPITHVLEYSVQSTLNVSILGLLALPSLKTFSSI